MRRLTLAVALMLAASLAVAQEPQRPVDPQSMGKKEMTAIVVSTDPEVKTITVKKEGRLRNPRRRRFRWPGRQWRS